MLLFNKDFFAIDDVDATNGSSKFAAAEVIDALELSLNSVNFLDGGNGVGSEQSEDRTGVVGAIGVEDAGVVVGVESNGRAGGISFESESYAGEVTTLAEEGINGHGSCFFGSNGNVGLATFGFRNCFTNIDVSSFVVKDVAAFGLSLEGEHGFFGFVIFIVNPNVVGDAHELVLTEVAESQLDAVHAGSEQLVSVGKSLVGNCGSFVAEGFGVGQSLDFGDSGGQNAGNHVGQRVNVGLELGNVGVDNVLSLSFVVGNNQTPDGAFVVYAPVRYCACFPALEVQTGAGLFSALGKSNTGVSALGVEEGIENLSFSFVGGGNAAGADPGLGSFVIYGVATFACRFEGEVSGYVDEGRNAVSTFREFRGC